MDKINRVEKLSNNFSDQNNDRQKRQNQDKKESFEKILRKEIDEHKCIFDKKI